MVENIFLTDHRREVLEGDSDMKKGSIANEKSRIRKRTKMAIEEIIEVAESDEIDNESIFDRETLNELVFAIIGEPPARYEADDMAKYHREHGYELSMFNELEYVTNTYRRQFATSAPREIEGGLRDE